MNFTPGELPEKPQENWLRFAFLIQFILLLVVLSIYSISNRANRLLAYYCDARCPNCSSLTGMSDAPQPCASDRYALLKVEYYLNTIIRCGTGKKMQNEANFLLFLSELSRRGASSTRTAAGQVSGYASGNRKRTRGGLPRRANTLADVALRRLSRISRLAPMSDII